MRRLTCDCKRYAKWFKDIEIGINKLDELAKNALYRGRWVALLISMHIIIRSRISS